MSLITLDFETYYDKQYSLSKITTEEYINSDEFEVIGVGIAKDAGAPEWFTGKRAVNKVLGRIDWPSCKLLAQNTAFDGAILGWRYGHKPALYLDTLGMARPIHSAQRSCGLASLAKYYKLPDKGTAVTNALGMRLEDFSPRELADYGDYCKHDVFLCREIFRRLMKEVPGGFPREELKIIDLLLRMYIWPSLELDVPLLQDHLQYVKDSKHDLLAAIIAQLKENLGENDSVIVKLVEMRLRGAGIKDIVMSDPMLAEMLIACGVSPPKKVSARTGKEAWAFAKTDRAFSDLTDHENPVVSAIASARLGIKSTIEESRTERFIGIAERVGELPIMLNYYGAHTGRCSGGEKLNLQNLPRGGALRRAIKAPEGHVVFACDSAQIEARKLAWLAGEQWLVDAFAADEDAYSMFAEEVYGYPVDKENTPSERQVGKVGILGLGYYMGAARFKDTVRVMARLDITEEEAQHVVTTYRAKHPKIRALWYAVGDALERMERGEDTVLDHLAYPLHFCGKTKRVFLPNGLWLSYPNLRKENGELVYDVKRGRSTMTTKIYSGKCVENIVQALARIVVFSQMVEVDKLLTQLAAKDPEHTYACSSTVHDEVVGVVPESMVHKILGVVTKIMSKCPDWAPGLPIACEAHYGANYADCK